VVADSNAAHPVVVTVPAQEGIEDNPGNTLLNAASWRCGLRIEQPGSQALEKSSKWTES